jgi:hypothetical protein
MVLLVSDLVILSLGAATAALFVPFTRQSGARYGKRDNGT